MQRQQQDRQSTAQQQKPWIDAVDLEMIFVNAIIVCVFVIVIVAADLLMS